MSLDPEYGYYNGFAGGGYGYSGGYGYVYGDYGFGDYGFGDSYGFGRGKNAPDDKLTLLELITYAY